MFISDALAQTAEVANKIVLHTTSPYNYIKIKPVYILNNGDAHHIWGYTTIFLPKNQEFCKLTC